MQYIMYIHLVQIPMQHKSFNLVQEQWHHLVDGRRMYRRIRNQIHIYIQSIPWCHHNFNVKKRKKHVNLAKTTITKKTTTTTIKHCGRKQLHHVRIKSKYSSEGAAREWSTVVNISILLPSFKPVPLFLSRFSLFKTPKQVFFNPIHILTLLPHFSLIIVINLLFFILTSIFSIFVTGTILTLRAILFVPLQ